MKQSAKWYVLGVLVVAWMMWVRLWDVGRYQMGNDKSALTILDTKTGTLWVFLTDKVKGWRRLNLTEAKSGTNGVDVTSKECK